MTLSVIAAGLALRTALLVGLLLASGAALRAQTVRWVAPTNWTGGSFSNGLTAGGPASFSLPTMRSWLQTNNLPDLIVYFYPGDYQVFDSANLEHRLRITGDSNRVVRLIGLVGTNGALPRLIMTPEPTNSAGMQNSARSWPPGFNQETLIATSNDGTTNNGAVFHDGISYRFYLGRVDLENLELDGNFEGQGAFTSAANPTGYKSMAINLTARTGRIRNVKVRHFGAVGQVPWSLVDGNSAGIESFPVWVITQDETNKPAYNDAPWVIEDVEVSDFHSLHDGYGTLIGGHGLMNNQPGQPFSADPLILIRRCMVNGGNTIAFGTAGTSSVRSGRIRVEDCVTLNSTVAFNTDTFSCGPWTMTNSVFLDFLNFGFLGQPNSGPNHLSYSVTDNLLRIRGRSQTPAYQEYYITNSTTWGTDPNLALGRWETNFATGLVFQGIAADITFSNNRFTTWPMTNFYLPDPANTAEAVFRAVWVVPSNTYVNSRWSERSRPPAQNVTLAQGRLSTTAFDFTGTNLWPDYNNLTSLLTNSAPLYTTNTTAISALPNGFAPQGRIERVLPRYDTNLHLAGVTEVAVGQTTLTAGTNLAVTVRAAEHRTVASGAPGTVPLGTNLWLTANFNLNNGATGSLAQSVALTTSTNNGTATTTLALPGTNCLVRLRTWLGPATNSAFAANQVAWASFDYAVGTVVSLTASPDVGDDKNTALAKRAKLHFTRTGPTSSALTVNFVLPTNGVPELTTPLDRRNLIASYGSTGSGDYYFATPTGGTLGTVIPGSTNTVTFNANSNEVVVSIITRADNLTEGNVVRVDLRGGAGYALGAKTRSDVYIYDGPEWTLVEMYPWYYGTAVTGLNSGVVDAAGQYTVNPLIVGTADFDDGSGMATHGGLYPWPSTYLTDFGRTFRPQAVSDRDSINDNILLVGFDGSAAKAFYNTPTNVTTLPRFAGVTSGTAAAYGVTVNVSGETHIVGFSSSINGVKRPALWLNFGVPTDLASLLPTNYAGVARASTWGDDIVVGDVDYAVTNAAGDAFLPRRGFRTLGTGWTIRKTGDDLPPPNSNGIPFESPTTANAVNLEGVAVGGYKYVVGQSTNIIATYWTSRSSGSNAAGTFLGVWVAPQGFSSFDTASEVIAINSAGRMVGYSGDGSTFKRAVLKKHATAPWLDLNDRHFVSGLTDWSLQRAVGINEQGIIIGNGTKSGSTRAFVLVPRTSGN